MSAAPPDVLLSVRDLAVGFGPVEAVRGVSFDIARGETLAIVGESGSGKSVTALSLTRLLTTPPARYAGGSVLFEGEDLMTAPEARLRKVRGNAISMIFQEPMSSLNPVHTIGQQIGEVLSLHRGLGGTAAKAETLRLLESVGLPDPESRVQSFPHQLSGGQRQRVMIAMALANDPALLVADEPTTALDVTVQAQILALLKKVQQQRGMAMLFITHDLGIVRHIADRVCVMQNGEIVESGPVGALFAAPRHPYTRKLIGAQLEDRRPPSDPSRPALLEAEDLKVWFPIQRGLFKRVVGHVKAVDGATITVREGETLGIVGESGSGKTTLGRAVLRLIGSKGPIRFEGQTVQDRSWRAMRPLRRDMQIVFQDPFGSLSPRMSVGEIVAEGLTVHERGLTASEREAKVIAALTDVGLDPESRHRYPHEFSGGQRQRVAIARALVLEPKLLVLDEPTSALDKSVQAQIVQLLRRLQDARGLTYLFISHDLAVVRALANSVVVMRHGKIVEAGDTATVLAQPAHPYTKALLAAALA